MKIKVINSNTEIIVTVYASDVYDEGATYRYNVILNDEYDWGEQIAEYERHLRSKGVYLDKVILTDPTVSDDLRGKSLYNG